MHLPLLLLIALAQDGGLVFEKDPVFCAAIEFEVRVPEGWKVAMDKTGMSVQGDGGGFVVTREPALAEAESFAEEWGALLKKAGIMAKVEKTRAGRYRAFHAQWKSPRAPGRRIDVFRIHVPDLEMLYNVSFSTSATVDCKELTEGVLKSFKATAKAGKLELSKSTTPVGDAGSIRLPPGCVEIPAGRFERGSKTYLRTFRGYEKPKTAIRVRVASIRAGARFPDGSGTTSDPEALNGWQGKKFGVPKLNWIKEPKSKAATYGGLKGAALTGRVRGVDGDDYEVCLWSGKGKHESPTILIVAHERETRLYKSYIKTILKSFKARK